MNLSDSTVTWMTLEYILALLASYQYLRETDDSIDWIIIDNLLLINNTLSKVEWNTRGLLARLTSWDLLTSKDKVLTC